jgi:tetratricopeptide (TPR) repeat protein
MLIVLDNARDSAQVRPLLPGTPGCLVLITSRNQLSSLVAAEGAYPLALELLDADVARELVVRRVGFHRADSEPEAVAEIVERCAGLPLALAVIAARAAINGHLSLTALADQLRRIRDRLDAFATGDPSTDLRAVLSWSHRALAPRAARMFWLLGLHPGPDISVPAAASLAGVGRPEARVLLAELARVNLVMELAAGRYTLHDLLRAYAIEIGERAGLDRQRRAATRRMFDHYLHSAFVADRLLYAARAPIVLIAPARGAAPEHMADHDDALTWFTTEHSVLLAVVDHAAALSARCTWQLAWTLLIFLDRRGHWEDLVATQRAAVAAAQRAAEWRAEASARRYLARAYTRLGRFDDAHTQLQRALDLYREAGDQHGQGHTHLNLALMWERWGHHADALDHARTALDLFQALDDRHGRACALNAVGWHQACLGDYHNALEFCQRALADHEDLDDRLGQADTWDSLGYAHHQLGQHTQAVVAYRHAIDLYREVGDLHLEGLVVAHLGDTHEAAGDLPAARAAWREAVDILDDLHPADAERVRTKLERRPTAAV